MSGNGRERVFCSEHGNDARCLTVNKVGKVKSTNAKADEGGDRLMGNERGTV